MRSVPPNGPAVEEWDDIRIAATLRTGWRRAQAAMTRALAEHGLSGLEYHLLLAVSVAGERGIRQVDLAQELNAPEGRVSVLARHLGDRMLVEAVRSEPDRRYVRLRLRSDGRRLLEAAMRGQREHLASTIGQLPESAVLRLVEYVIRSYLGIDLRVVPSRTSSG